MVISPNYAIALVRTAADAPRKSINRSFRSKIDEVDILKPQIDTFHLPPYFDLNKITKSKAPHVFFSFSEDSSNPNCFLYGLAFDVKYSVDSSKTKPTVRNQKLVNKCRT